MPSIQDTFSTCPDSVLLTTNFPKFLPSLRLAQEHWFQAMGPPPPAVSMPSPLSPFSPFTPCGPGAPVSPVSPAAPGRPAVPGAPGAPACPGPPCGPGVRGGEEERGERV